MTNTTAICDLNTTMVFDDTVNPSTSMCDGFAISIALIIVSLICLLRSLPFICGFFRGSNSSTNTSPWVHIRARSKYPCLPDRTNVPDHFVSWRNDMPGYNPQLYTHPDVIKNNRLTKPDGWADPSDISMMGDSLKDLQSLEGYIELDSNGRPMNPCGRTGLRGQGILGKWGPNYAADPIVVRYNSNTQTWQVVLIKRRDTGESALPGGMVDKDEIVSATVKREFKEEAGAFPEGSPEREKFDKLANKLFSNGRLIYQGYVDDPRNTDNSWMETSAFLFICSDELGQMLPLFAGDDATRVWWEDFDPKMTLWGDHGRLLKMAYHHLMRV